MEPASCQHLEIDQLQNPGKEADTVERGYCRSRFWPRNSFDEAYMPRREQHCYVSEAFFFLVGIMSAPQVLVTEFNWPGF